MATATKTTYMAEVLDAAKAEKELRRLNSRPANWLTAEAYLREAMQLAHVTRADLDRIRAELDRGGDVEFPHSWRGMRRLANEFVRHSARARGTYLAARIGAYCDTDTLTELSALGASTLAALALAVVYETQRHGDASFGTCPDADALAAKVAELRVQVSALTAKLNRMPATGDLDAGKLQNGELFLSVGNGNLLPVLPVRDLGIRAVSWACDHPDEAGR